MERQSALILEGALTFVELSYSSSVDSPRQLLQLVLGVVNVEEGVGEGVQDGVGVGESVADGVGDGVRERPHNAQRKQPRQTQTAPK